MLFFFFTSLTHRNAGSLANRNQENIYNENMIKSINNVQTAAALCGTSAITAVKVTAFVAPSTLQKLNLLIEQEQSQRTTGILDLVSKKSTVND